MRVSEHGDVDALHDHDRFPAALADLVPQYIDEVPIDVFSGEPLIYDANGEDEPLLYSVGRNLVDDSASAKKVRNPDRPARIRPADIVYWPPQ